MIDHCAAGLCCPDNPGTWATRTEAPVGTACAPPDGSRRRRRLPDDCHVRLGRAGSCSDTRGRNFGAGGCYHSDHPDFRAVGLPPRRCRRTPLRRPCPRARRLRPRRVPPPRLRQPCTRQPCPRLSRRRPALPRPPHHPRRSPCLRRSGLPQRLTSLSMFTSSSPQGTTRLRPTCRPTDPRPSTSGSRARLRRARRRWRVPEPRWASCRSMTA